MEILKSPDQVMTNKHVPRFSRGLRILKTLLLVWILIPTEKNIAQTIQRPAITGIASIDLRTRDMNRLVDVYNTLLGFKYKSHLASTTNLNCLLTIEELSVDVSDKTDIQTFFGNIDADDPEVLILG